MLKTHICIYMVRRLAFPTPPPTMVWSEGGRRGGAGNARGLRGLLGPSLHPNLDPKAHRTQSPGLKLVCCSIIWQTIACCSLL